MFGFFTDFSFTNWKDLLPDNPGEILLTAASDQLMEHLGLAGYLKKEQCSATSTASTVKGWNDGNSAVICSSVTSKEFNEIYDSQSFSVWWTAHYYKKLKLKFY